jgi:hypothetical protein
MSCGKATFEECPAANFALPRALVACVVDWVSEAIGLRAGSRGGGGEECSLARKGILGGIDG